MDVSMDTPMSTCDNIIQRRMGMRSLAVRSRAHLQYPFAWKLLVLFLAAGSARHGHHVVADPIAAKKALEQHSVSHCGEQLVWVGL